MEDMAGNGVELSTNLELKVNVAYEKCHSL
jgi:hypothetical protein